MIELCDFLHPGERDLLRKILNIALQYHEIEEFRKKVANRDMICDDVMPG